MDLVIRNARHDRTGERVDVGIADGLIVAVAPEGIGPGARELDAGGALISPALIEPHFHLENALLWDVPNRSGTLEEAIRVYAAIKRDMPADDIMRRASAALREAVANGVLWLRCHVDIDRAAGLRILDAILAVRERFRDLIDVQVIAFPQHGMARDPAVVDLMWAAMERGADLVGGMPHGERDMDDAARQIEIAFEIARHYDADIDMHIDETDNPYWHSLEPLAEQTIANGYQGRVTAGHCCAMAAWDDAMAARIIGKVRQADVHVITNAPINLLLEGRHDSQPVRRGIARVKELLAAGVNVTCGQDDVQNMFYPYGRMDPLEVALITAHAAHLAAPDEIQAAFDMPRYHAARMLRLPAYGVEPGAPADLVLLDAASPVDALRRHSPQRTVIRRGQVLVRTRVETEWA
ncbi:MAG: cytosine deaminase [Anaerolineae bacterium]|nr:MAG: cytosine deaminase [Anaerolineae bacterium]